MIIMKNKRKRKIFILGMSLVVHQLAMKNKLLSLRRILRITLC